MNGCEEGTVRVLDNDTLESKGIARVEVSDRRERGVQGKRLYLYGFDQYYDDVTEVVISVGGVQTSLRIPPRKKC